MTLGSDHGGSSTCPIASEGPCAPGHHHIRSLWPGATAKTKRRAVRSGLERSFARVSVAPAVCCGSRRVVDVSEIPVDDVPGDVARAARDAARGQVIYLTEHGERLAAIVPAELAEELENLTPEELRELLEDFADVQAAREALAEIGAGANPVPAAQVWAELGLDS
jgi:antitoxin Phd